MDLTQEHFDQVISGFATRKDLEESLGATERRLMQHAGQLQAELARMVGDGFVDLQNRLDVRQRVERHEEVIKQLAAKAGLKLQW
jgi:uncharacterized Zn finger protein